MTISGAITPPTWWVTQLQGRVKMGAGRAPVPPGMFRQADLLAKILEDCGNEHTAPEMSRALKGERIPIQLAIDLSEVLEMPAPVYVAETDEEAARLESQRAVTRLLMAAADRAEGQLADTAAGAGKSSKRRQTGAIKRLGGEEKSPDRRGESG